MAGVTYSDIDVIIRGFNALPSAVGTDVRAAQEPVWTDLKGALAIYPATRANQRYRRTGDLGRGWTNATPQYVVRSDGSIDGRLSNPVSYDDFVQGDAQTMPFKGRWTLASTIMTEFEGDFTVATEQGTIAALRRAGLGGA